VFVYTCPAPFNVFALAHLNCTLAFVKFSIFVVPRSFWHVTTAVLCSLLRSLAVSCGALRSLVVPCSMWRVISAVPCGLTKSWLHNRTTTIQSGRPRSRNACTSHLSNYNCTPIISSHQSTMWQCKTAQLGLELIVRPKCLYTRPALCIVEPGE